MSATLGEKLKEFQFRRPTSLRVVNFSHSGGGSRAPTARPGTIRNRGFPRGTLGNKVLELTGSWRLARDMPLSQASAGNLHSFRQVVEFVRRLPSPVWRAVDRVWWRSDRRRPDSARFCRCSNHGAVGIGYRKRTRVRVACGGAQRACGVGFIRSMATLAGWFSVDRAYLSTLRRTATPALAIGVSFAVAVDHGPP